MKTYTAIIATLVLAGCMTVGNNQIQDTEVTKQIEAGKSTKAEVKSLVGDPTKTLFSDTGEETWEYILTKSQTRPSSFIPFVGLVVGGADIQTHTLTVRFGKDGVVNQVGTGKSTGGAGSILD